MAADCISERGAKARRNFGLAGRRDNGQRAWARSLGGQRHLASRAVIDTGFFGDAGFALARPMAGAGVGGQRTEREGQRSEDRYATELLSSHSSLVPWPKVGSYHSFDQREGLSPLRSGTRKAGHSHKLRDRALTRQMRTSGRLWLGCIWPRGQFSLPFGP